MQEGGVFYTPVNRGGVRYGRVIKGRKNDRVSRNLALHVLEIMLACKKSEEEKTYYKMKSKCSKPALMHSELIKGMV